MPPTLPVVRRKSGAMTSATSRTSATSNDQAPPSSAGATPGEAMTIGRSVVTRTRTIGLVGVTNGSPWFGRSKGTARLTQGIQRYIERVPSTREKSQSEPAEVVAEPRGVGDPDRHARPVREEPAERDLDRLVRDLGRHRSSVDRDGTQLHAAEPGRHGVEVDAVDGLTGIVAGRDRRPDIDVAGCHEDPQVDVVGRGHGEGGSADARRARSPRWVTAPASAPARGSASASAAASARRAPGWSPGSARRSAPVTGSGPGRRRRRGRPRAAAEPGDGSASGGS